MPFLDIDILLTQVCIFFFAKGSATPETQIYFRIGGIIVTMLNGRKSIFLAIKSNKTIIVPGKKQKIDYKPFLTFTACFYIPIFFFHYELKFF